MEHVPGIIPAFSEMNRVLAKGGLLYSFAAPLWNSRDGHHVPQYFPHVPWAHLRFSKDQALNHLFSSGIAVAAENGDARDVVEYMFDKTDFNMRPSADYTKAVDRLTHLNVIYNVLQRDANNSSTHQVLSDLASGGYAAMN